MGSGTRNDIECCRIGMKADGTEETSHNVARSLPNSSLCGLGTILEMK